MPDTTMLTHDRPRTNSDLEQHQGRVGAIGWGLLFLWLGIALLANLGMGIGLIGSGIIVFGAQAARRFIFDLPFEATPLIIGVALVLGGFGKLVNGQVDLVPLVSLAAGAAILVHALTRKTGSLTT
jgi:hypothetical protein